MLKKIILTTALAAGLATSASAFDAEIEGDLSVGYFSKYIWRGQAINDESVIQTGIGFQVDKIYLNLWGNMDLTDEGEKNNFTEVDFTAEYSDSLTEGVDYTLGVIRYDFDEDAGNTNEIYGGLSFDMPLSPSFTVYRDIDAIEGTYFSAGVSHSFSLGEDMALDCAASLGYADSDYNLGYWGVDDSSMQDLALSASMPLAMGDWTLTPSVTYAAIMDDELKETDAYEPDPDYIYAGISLSTTF
ncbi:hypothetical protein L21SP3_01402 [Sedimentisphaera cyanobacteriorum]|uniref:Uncharacterized protein n=1 Tax=Sedimentisphaera cyanobacteriorum TaxID=1940790 RepID=A0A1Q2HQP0_9BACT|nr:hypothetical protein [Sedimentisphaera cyanobacteriorum]AQQ09594.1 hypothetical protein L21SP3_01402 [Sedimentisphaera cyanobacteriorum]